MTQPTRGRWRRTLVNLMAIVILGGSCYGFGSKFIELVAVYRGDAEGAFAIAPIVNYLLASAGFLMLFLWATLNGMFADIEQPKYAMLRNEEQLDGPLASPEWTLFKRNGHDRR